MMNCDTIMFDLGGVLVQWDGVSPLIELTRNRFTAEDARRFWLDSPWVRSFEIGTCNQDEFARGVIRDLALDLEPADFLAQFEAWDRGALPGAIALLAELSKKYPLACLSNNNPIHWNNLRRCGLLDYFQHRFVSFQIGCFKPDRAAFAHAIEKLGVPPENILYFDDSPECVQAASQIGINARQARGVESVRVSLQEMGIAI